MLVDFGADTSFDKCVLKAKLHYGITIPYSAQRNLTYKHSKIIKANQTKLCKTVNTKSHKNNLLKRKGVLEILSETDGSMIPIVSTYGKDKRKNKQVFWKEIRLTLARDMKSINKYVSATLDDVNIVGQHMRYCIDRVGLGYNSYIHAVGDGAPWIAGQVDKHFGVQAKYLIDFYHASEYLASASHECASIEPKKWLHAQQQLLKCGKYETVLTNLSSYAHQHEESATYKCYHYLKNRTHQLHYHEAIKNKLPIGSGEIESAHRYVIQHRLKIPGAWWLIENADSMAHLNVCRANGDWDRYWDDAMAA